MARKRGAKKSAGRYVYGLSGGKLKYVGRASAGTKALPKKTRRKTTKKKRRK